MNIALIGYGKMGKAIEEIIIEEGKHQVVLKITESNLDEFNLENLKSVDVAIEFTQPSRAYENVMKCFEANVPVVTGTTAWLEGLEKAKTFCAKQDKTLFSAPNFSIGVNLFFQLNKQLARLMQPFENYKLSMEEIHHTEKIDAPSGTAVKLAEDLIAEDSNNFKNWNLGTERKENSIPIQAIREEGVPGTHTVKYESDIDFIEISHEAESRKGFAMGALRAAEFIYGKTGYFTMDDLLSLK